MSVTKDYSKPPKFVIKKEPSKDLNTLICTVYNEDGTLFEAEDVVHRSEWLRTHFPKESIESNLPKIKEMVNELIYKPAGFKSPEFVFARSPYEAWRALPKDYDFGKNYHTFNQNLIVGSRANRPTFCPNTIEGVRDYIQLVYPPVAVGGEELTGEHMVKDFSKFCDNSYWHPNGIFAILNYEFLSQVEQDKDWENFNYVSAFFKFNELYKAVYGLHCSEHICIIVDFPLYMEKMANAQGTVVVGHPTKPCIEFRDGFKVYSISGMYIPEKFFVNPESITLEEIQKEENADRRRIYVERWAGLDGIQHGAGVVKYLSAIGAKEIDSYEDPIEVTKAVLYNCGDYNTLIATCKTGRLADMNVPVTCHTVTEAQKWLHSSSVLDGEIGNTRVIGRS